MDIEIIPGRPGGTVKAPVSKSFLHRAVICAVLAHGTSRIYTDSLPDDAAATVGCVQAMGAEVSYNNGFLEITPPPVYESRAVLNCRESGSTLRFLLPVCAALGIEAEFIRGDGLKRRPVSDVLIELSRHGIKISGDPLKISGRLSAGRFTLPADISSQGVSGMLMALPLTGGEVSIPGVINSEDYVNLTVGVMKHFGISLTREANVFFTSEKRYRPVSVQAEGDWSGAAFFLAAGAGVTGLDLNSLQGDKIITDVLRDAGAKDLSGNGTFRFDTSSLHGFRLDAARYPDLVPVAAVLAATADGVTVISNTDRLRYKESDRVAALLSLLDAAGAQARYEDGKIIINGKPSLRGGEADSFNDHRIVMAAAVLSAKCDGSITIKNADAVNKSYPGFFRDFTSLGGKINVLQLR